MSTGGSGPIAEIGGISELEKTLKSGGKAKTKAPIKILGSTLKKEIALPDKVVAKIDSSKCINCGTCRENCPVDAIVENQRQICHVCPTCTEIPGISVRKMKSLPTETSCTTKCPLGISPQGYLALTKSGNYDAAYELVWSKNPLPAVCGRVCHHPCEEGCKRGILVDKPIKIREIKRYLSEKTDYKPPKYVRKYEEEIAVIGAGPAGLTAAHYLALAGYGVTVFEASDKPGGMLVRCIPEFRLPREVVLKDIAKLQGAGLDIRLNQKINKYSVEKLKSEYDAIIVATGRPKSKELFIEGWRLAGIMTAINFMEQVNSRQRLRRHLGQLFKFDGGEAVIIGGGSVAIDVARTALRVGASKVTVVCLECGNEIPAHPWELEEAREEGIEIIEGYSPTRFTSDLYPTLTGVEFNKVLSLKKDEQGQFIVETDLNDKIWIKADWVVVAIGQGYDTLWDDIAEDGVFYAGDIHSNKCSVIDAMASGRKTALEVDAKLRGRRLKDPVDDSASRLVCADVYEKLFPYNFRKIVRPTTPKLPLEERLNTFKEVEQTFNDQEAYTEADSCLGCGFEAVDPEKCIGCGICAKLCPKGDVITLVAKSEGVEKA